MATPTNHIDGLVQQLSQAMGWAEEETRNFMRAMRAPSADLLMEHLEKAFEYAKRIETAHAMITLMKTLPPGTIEAEWNGTELAVRINPEAQVNTVGDEIHITPAGDA